MGIRPISASKNGDIMQQNERWQRTVDAEHSGGRYLTGDKVVKRQKRISEPSNF